MSGFLRRQLLWISLILTLSYFPFAYAEESVLDFHSRIVVNLDASADITETITVNAERQAIQHGISRILLQYFYDAGRVQHYTRYHIRSIQNNGYPSDYHTSRNNDLLFIYVGNKDTILTPGVYVYTLQYHVENVVGFLSDRDELYWNITGNGWPFPIMQVEADVILPVGENINRYFGYTGRYGALGTNYQADFSAPNQAHFETRQPLAPNEGFTIGVSWPVGAIKPTTFWQNLFHGGKLIGLEVFLFLLVYYIAVWAWESREPAAGEIIPLFAPPVGLSPAAMRFIYKMRFDDKAFTTAIVSMATKGYVTIVQQGGQYTIVKKGDNLKLLSHGELALAAVLFNSSNMVDLTSQNHTAIRAAKLALKDSLKTEFENIYFSTHAIYLVPGMLLAVLGLMAISMDVFSDFSEILSAGLLGLFGCMYLIRFYTTFSNVVRLCRQPSMLLCKEIIFSLVSLLYVALFIWLFHAYLLVYTPLEAVLFLSIIVLNVIFYHVLRVHTPDGRKLMDQIEGFKMYLVTTDQIRFNVLNPPDKTPELFEKYFPYALALDVENEWSKQFYTVLTATTTQQQTHYSPMWYVGAGWSATTASVFASDLNNGVTSSVSASSGGGFSGGGGGGGGGGGW